MQQPEVQEGIGHQLPDLAVNDGVSFQAEVIVEPGGNLSGAVDSVEQREQQEDRAIGDEQLLHRAREGRKAQSHQPMLEVRRIESPCVLRPSLPYQFSRKGGAPPKGWSTAQRCIIRGSSAYRL